MTATFNCFGSKGNHPSGRYDIRKEKKLWLLLFQGDQDKMALAASDRNRLIRFLRENFHIVEPC